jgi:hypothetical protein
MRKLAVLALALVLAACGVRADLKPAPYGREDKSNAAKLLVSTPQAVPERSVELRKRS